MKYGTMYLVGTPVGSIEDIPKRNIDLIKNTKTIVIETRSSFKRLMSKLKVDISDKNIISIFSNNYIGVDRETSSIETIIKILKDGQDVVVVSDEGMPGIADPGYLLVKDCIFNNINISSTPGPSSLIAAVSIAGCQDRFSFHGYIPLNSEMRSLCLKNLEEQRYSSIFMLGTTVEETWSTNPEILNVFDDIIKIWGNRNAVLCYNLTTSKEKTIRGNLSYLKEYYLSNQDIHDMVMIVIDGKEDILTMPSKAKI